MSIAIFATKVFKMSADMLYTFDEFQYNSALQTEKQDAVGSKPSTYDKGPDLDTLSFKTKLDAMYGVNPRREWEDWLSLMNASVAYPFILGGKPLGCYSWLLVGVSPSDVRIDNDGNILSMELNLKFDEYVRPGSASNSSTTKKSKSSDKTLEGLSSEDMNLLLSE